MKLLFTLILIVISITTCFAQNKDSIKFQFWPNTFYTWTTAEQINNLRTNKLLLTKSKSETKGSSVFDISLRDSTLRNNENVQIMLDPMFAKKRFAWTNSWATIMGWENEKYGDQLIKIVIGDSAIVGIYNTEDEVPLRFYNMQGKMLDTDYVKKNKDRITVIYHWNIKETPRSIFKTKRKGTYYKETAGVTKTNNYAPFREYVIVNEKMIKSWSYGTKEIKKLLSNEIKELQNWASKPEAKQKAYSRYNYYPWSVNSDALTLQDQYRGSTCLQNDYYLFNKKKINAIIEALKKALAAQQAEIMK